MSESKAYSYKPLENPRDIRLIVLHPGVLRSPIHLSLEVASLDSLPNYEALSYHWGDPKNRAPVFCDDCVLQVTVNLHSALDRLRFPDRTRVLWADAICIDQEHNLAEKSAQVLLMTDVYSLASRVLIWLGDDITGVENVQAVITRGLEVLPPESVDPEEMQRRITELSGNDSAARSMNWDPFIKLTRHTWFERKWIVQEAALAKEAVIIRGTLELPWDSVQSLALRLLSYNVAALLSDEEYDAKTQDFQLYNIAMIMAARMYRPAATLLDTIKATKKFVSTNPRDQIYGLLGLVTNKQGIAKDIVPDYNSSVEDVYRRFAEDMLIKDKDLGILSLAPFMDTPWQQSTLSLPSWVPDLTVQHLDSITGYTVREGKFAAGGPDIPSIFVEPGTSHLVCSGIIFDKIAKLSYLMTEQPDPGVPEKIPGYLKTAKKSIIRLVIRQQLYFKECEKLVAGSDGIDSLSPKRFSEFWKTMICERVGLSNRIKDDISMQFKEYFHGLMGAMHEDDTAARTAFMRCLKYSAMIEPTLTGMAFSRRFCVTDGDRLGQVPRLANHGDLICVLFGGNVPFVIRPTGKETYRLIGECYISGVMDGELLRATDAQKTSIVLE